MFFSLDELNAAMAEKLRELNARPLSADKTLTRAKLFEDHEKPLLKPLPPEPFVVGRWERYKLSPDYHVSIEGVAYSAPFGHLIVTGATGTGNSWIACALRPGQSSRPRRPQRALRAPVAAA